MQMRHILEYYYSLRLARGSVMMCKVTGIRMRVK